MKTINLTNEILTAELRKKGMSKNDRIKDIHIAERLPAWKDNKRQEYVKFEIYTQESLYYYCLYDSGETEIFYVCSAVKKIC